MTLVGHLVWSLPFLWVFGTSFEALHAGQTVAAAIGLVLAHLLLRRFLPTGLALLGTAVVAAFPGYALLATSYMTDTTAFAAQMGCLLLGVLALERAGRGRRLFLLSLAVGLYAYTIRETALAAPLAVLAGWWVAGGREERREVAALAVGLLAIAAAFFVWRHSLEGDEEPWLFGDAPVYDRVADVARSYFTVAFALLPVVLLLVVREPRALIARGPLVASVAALLVGGIVAARSIDGRLTLFAGNALTRVGAVDVALPGRPPLFSAPEWALMALAALAGGVLLAGLAALVLRAAAGTSGLYDRYLWGIAIAVLILVGPGPELVGRARRVGIAGASAALVAIAVVSLAILLEENTSSAARWEAGEAAVARGIPATAVDAGFEWMGLHYPHLAGEPEGEAAWADPGTWYNVLKFPAASNCVLMSYAPRKEPWLEPVEVRRYTALLAWADRTLFVYRNPRACAA